MSSQGLKCAVVALFSLFFHTSLISTLRNFKRDVFLCDRTFADSAENRPFILFLQQTICKHTNLRSSFLHNTGVWKMFYIILIRMCVCVCVLSLLWMEFLDRIATACFLLIIDAGSSIKRPNCFRICCRQLS